MLALAFQNQEGESLQKPYCGMFTSLLVVMTTSLYEMIDAFSNKSNCRLLVHLCGGKQCLPWH